MMLLDPKRSQSVASAFGLILLLNTASVTAEPRFAQMYKQHAGYMPSCNACHRDGGGSDVNGYGEAFKAAGANAASFNSIAKQDADADGFTNGTEMAAKANPGQSKSTPDAPGNWLDTANLIPREVQKIFPGVTRYKPMDAILTSKEVARAKALGVALSKQDDTTIYIPIGDKKPVGTAIIVPAMHDDKSFFLILATDRKLNVTEARTMHAARLPAAEKSAALKQVVGKPVHELPAGEGDSLDAHILNALKKAGAILYVRLKPA